MAADFQAVRGYAGWRPGQTLPKAIVMVGSESDHCLAAILRARELGPDRGGLPLGAMKVLSNVSPEKSTCRPLTAAAGLEYLSKPSGKMGSQERRDHMAWVKREWESFRPDAIILAKYMVVLESDVLAVAPWQVVNVHHGVLPAFIGRRALRAALQAGVGLTGATCHFVTEQLDQGPVIDQVYFPIDRESPDYEGPIGSLVRACIPLMKEAEEMVLLRGLGFYLRGGLRFVSNADVQEGDENVEPAVRKEDRLRQSAPHEVDLSQFGPFSLLQAAWATYAERHGLEFSM